MRYVLLVVALLGAACTSFPDASRLPADVVARIRAAPSPHFRAHVACDPSDCKPARDGDRVSCEETVAEVKRLLSGSPWFDTLEAGRAEANLLIAVHPLERTPYFESPAHSPAALLLVLVVPIPWKLRAGYCLSARVPGSGEAVRVDTRRKATALSWSLAPLLNLHPDRSFLPSPRRELDQIHAQLLPLVESTP